MTSFRTISAGQRAKARAEAEEAMAQGMDWRRSQQEGRRDARARADRRAKDRAKYDAGPEPNRRDYKDPKEYRQARKFHNEDRRANYAEYERQKRADQKEMRRKTDEARDWIRENSIPGGYGSRVGDEYRVRGIVDKLNDPRHLRKYQEGILRDQAGRRENDLNRWSQAYEDGAEWATAGFDDLKSGPHWTQGSQDAYEAMQSGRRPMNYRDFFNLDELIDNFKIRNFDRRFTRRRARTQN